MTNGSDTGHIFDPTNKDHLQGLRQDFETGLVLGLDTRRIEDSDVVLVPSFGNVYSVHGTFYLYERNRHSIRKSAIVKP